MHTVARCGDNVIADIDNATGTVVRTYVTPGLDANVSMTDVGTSATYYYNADERQSVMNLTDSTGATVQSYGYSAYGDKVDALTTGTVEQRYTFTGRELSAVSSDYYFRYRWYGAASGSFMSRDPLGFVDGMSVYAGWFAGRLALDPNGIRFVPYDGSEWTGHFPTFTWDIIAPCTYLGHAIVSDLGNDTAGNKVAAYTETDVKPDIGLEPQRCCYAKGVDGYRYTLSNFKCTIKIKLLSTLDPEARVGSTGLTFWEHEVRHAWYFVDYVNKVVSAYKRLAYPCIPKQCDKYRTTLASLNKAYYDFRRYEKDADLHAREYAHSETLGSYWKRIRALMKKNAEDKLSEIGHTRTFLNNCVSQVDWNLISDNYQKEMPK